MVTIYDLAVHCHCAPSTVSKVLNGYPGISRKTVEKVEKAVKELNYIPNEGAVSLSKAKNNNVGILAYYGMNITIFGHELFTDISNSFQKTMNESKYDIYFVSKNVLGKEETFYRNCKSRSLSGVLLFGNMHQNEMIEMMDSDIPCVAFDYLGDKNVSSVCSDNHNMMKELTEYVIKKGHKDIVYISGEDTTKVTQIRYQAFKETLKNNGISFDEKTNYFQVKYKDYDGTFNLVMNLLKKHKPTLIMCPDDYCAAACIKAITKSGYSCPNDISVTGFDGVDLAKYITPTLTTMHQDTEKIGTELANLLTKKIADPDCKAERIIVNGDLFEGESVKDLNGK